MNVVLAAAIVVAVCNLWFWCYRIRLSLMLLWVHAFCELILYSLCMNGMLVVANVALQTIVVYVRLLCINVTFVATNTCCIQWLLSVSV